MSKLAKYRAAKIFLTLWKITGYRVKKITRFSAEDNPQTIAIFSTTALGDFLLNTPAIKAIKTRWPNARLLLVIHKNNKALAAGSPLFDEIYYWDGKAKGLLSIAKTLRQQRTEASFILHARSPYDILAAALAGSRYIIKTVYFNDYHQQKTFMLEPFLSAHYDIRPDGNVHLVHLKTRVLANLGIDIPSEEMFIPAPCKTEVLDHIVIGMHAGASRAERRWPVEKFSQLIQSVLADYPNVMIELIGAAGEKELNQQIIDGLPSADTRVKNVAGTTTLQQLATKISGFTCLVVGDTGPLHVAIALRTPVVGLFGNQGYVDGAAPLQDREIHKVVMSPDAAEGIRAIEVSAVKKAIGECIAQKSHSIS